MSGRRWTAEKRREDIRGPWPERRKSLREGIINNFILSRSVVNNPRGLPAAAATAEAQKMDAVAFHFAQSITGPAQRSRRKLIFTLSRTNSQFREEYPANVFSARNPFGYPSTWDVWILGIREAIAVRGYAERGRPGVTLSVVTSAMVLPVDGTTTWAPGTSPPRRNGGRWAPTGSRVTGNPRWISFSNEENGEYCDSFKSERIKQQKGKRKSNAKIFLFFVPFFFSFVFVRASKKKQYGNPAVNRFLRGFCFLEVVIGKTHYLHMVANVEKHGNTERIMIGISQQGYNKLFTQVWTSINPGNRIMMPNPN